MPEVVLADVDVVMLPKAPAELGTRQLLQRLYGGYAASRFEPVAASDYWLAYRRVS